MLPDMGSAVAIEVASFTSICNAIFDSNGRLINEYQSMKNKKLWGRLILFAALVLLVVGELLTTGIGSLFVTLGAMGLGFVGLLLAFAEGGD